MPVMHAHWPTQETHLPPGWPPAMSEDFIVQDHGSQFQPHWHGGIDLPGTHAHWPAQVTSRCLPTGWPPGSLPEYPMQDHGSQFQPHWHAGIGSMPAMHHWPAQMTYLPPGCPPGTISGHGMQDHSTHFQLQPGHSIHQDVQVGTEVRSETTRRQRRVPRNRARAAPSVSSLTPNLQVSCCHPTAPRPRPPPIPPPPLRRRRCPSVQVTLPSKRHTQET